MAIKYILMVVICALLVPSFAGAETFEYVIDGLVGTYEYHIAWSSRDTAIVTVPDSLGHIVSAYFVLSGDADVGSVWCRDSETFEDWGISISAGMVDPAAGVTWLASAQFHHDGPYDAYSTIFYGAGGSGAEKTLDFLLGNPTEFTVSAFYGSDDFECARSDYDMAVSVVSAKLVLEVEQSLPVSSTSWGTLKARFR